MFVPWCVIAFCSWRLSWSPETPLWRWGVTGRWRRRWTSPDWWRWDTWRCLTLLTCRWTWASNRLLEGEIQVMMRFHFSFPAASAVVLWSTTIRPSIESPPATRSSWRASKGSSTLLLPPTTPSSARYKINCLKMHCCLKSVFGSFLTC